MPRRTIGFIVFAILVSLGCLRLGFWQLARLGERRAFNATIEGRMSKPRVAPADVTGDPSAEQYRGVRVVGRFDYDNELSIAGRPRHGSPGVYLLTPVKQATSDTAILLIRGWVYAPDSKSVQLDRWHEGDSVAVDGFIEDYVPAKAPVTVPNAPRSVRVADYDSLRVRLPYPIARFIVAQTSDSAERADYPARLSLPALDDGPHRGYALQWFVFALIAWIGIGAVVRKGRASPQ